MRSSFWQNDGSEGAPPLPSYLFVFSSHNILWIQISSRFFSRAAKRRNSDYKLTEITCRCPGHWSCPIYTLSLTISSPPTPPPPNIDPWLEATAGGGLIKPSLGLSLSDAHQWELLTHRCFYLFIYFDMRMPQELLFWFSQAIWC